MQDATAVSPTTEATDGTGTNTVETPPPIDVEANGKGGGKMKPRGKPFQRGADARRKKGEKGEGNGEGEIPPPFVTFTQHGAQAADMVLALMMQQQQQQMQEIREEMKNPETKITIKHKHPDGSSEESSSKTDGKVHRIFTEVMETILSGLKNILLVGPAGSGKTTLAKQVTAALKIVVADHPLVQALAGKNNGTPFGSVSCSAGMTESALTGRLLPTGEAGRFEYHETPFIALFEHGGGFLMDEVDAADANVLLVGNSALDNGHLDLPNRVTDPVALRHDSNVMMFAANTFGLGANRQYVGRNQLDAAFLDRFAGAVIEMPYDKDLERAIVEMILPVADATAWLDAAWLIRDKVEHTGLRRIWGTRALKHGAKLQAAGMKQRAVLKRLTSGWSADEREKAGVRV